MRAIIVEDRAAVRLALHQMLALFCAESVEVVAEAGSVRAAIRSIQQEKPDLVFMDIDLSLGQDEAGEEGLPLGQTGFDVLDAFPLPLPFQVIFVTDYQEYAVRAFELAAVGYILKPISPAMLVKYVGRAQQQHEQQQSDAYGAFKRNQEAPSFEEQVLAVPLIKSVMLFVPIKDIIYIEADGDCSVLVLAGQRVVSTRGIGKFEKRLEAEAQRGSGFIRTHHSYLVNPLHIRKYFKNDAYLEMSNGARIAVSKAKRNLELIKFD